MFGVGAGFGFGYGVAGLGVAVGFGVGAVAAGGVGGFLATCDFFAATAADSASVFSGAERTADAGGSSRVAEPGGAFPGGGTAIPDAIGGTDRARNDSGGMGDGGA